MGTKKFSYILYKENDAIARAFIKGLLSTCPDLSIIDNPYRYGVDLLIFRNDHYIANIECEIKQAWSEEFPYETVDFPARKLKFCALERHTLFVMLNKSLTDYLWVPDNTLKVSSTKEKDTIYSTNELFIEVPLDVVRFSSGLIEELKVLSL